MTVVTMRESVKINTTLNMPSTMKFEFRELLGVVGYLIGMKTA